MKNLLVNVGFASCLLLSGCDSGELSSADVERLLGEKKIYPLTVEHRIYCNSEDEARQVSESNLEKEGLVTVQLRHTVTDVGTPLIRFTDKASQYLITTSDTLKSLDIQKVKLGEEIFTRVNKIEINPAGDKAVVDYTVDLQNTTPFVILSKLDTTLNQSRRTFFTKKSNTWTWDGRIVKMPKVNE